MSFNFLNGGFTGNSIAIGYYTATPANKGGNSIAIGVNAGLTGQPANSIVLNASGNALNGNTANACYVAPIRNNAIPITGSYPLYYNPSLSEVFSRSTAGGYLMRNNTTTQSITSGQWTIVLFPNVARSVGNFITDLSYNNGVFTNISGVPMCLSVSGTCSFAANPTGFRLVSIDHSVLYRISTSSAGVTGAAGGGSATASGIVYLLANESFSIKVWTSEVSLSLYGSVADYATTLTAVLLN